ncbi:MAG: hypothetical protein IT452_23645 [Planctomycetia bacterium]|nr:hypothetical protein [Planctomycetia bacterium]
MLLVLVLGEVSDQAKVLRQFEELAPGLELADRAWVAPTERLAEQVRGTGGAVLAAGVNAEVCALVAVPTRPALLVVGPDGRIGFAHLPEFHWDALTIAGEVDSLMRESAPTRGRPKQPVPGREHQGALECAVCHRAQFVDWLLTPHSVALRDLEQIGRDSDAACLPCHVTGWDKPGGFTAGDADRRLADVQCGACHDPERTHAGDQKIRIEEYPARCRTCHASSASIAHDIKLSLPQVRHGKAKDADRVVFDLREEAIRKFKEQTYFQFCAKTAYVGSESCKSCHEQEHKQWAASPHARAFKSLSEAGKESAPACLRCHTTGVGHEGGFQGLKETPGVAEVGCESCHGPGKLHIQANSPEERLQTIFRFDDKCPTCVVQRICSTCHDAENDPSFELGRRLSRVRHKAR